MVVPLKAAIPLRKHQLSKMAKGTIYTLRNCMKIPIMYVHISGAAYTISKRWIHTYKYICSLRYVTFTYDTYCNAQSWINLKEDESIKVIIIRLIFCYYDDTFSLNLGLTPKYWLWCLSYLDKKIKTCLVSWVSKYDGVEKYSSKLPALWPLMVY